MNRKRLTKCTINYESITLCDARIGPSHDGVKLFLEPGEYLFRFASELGAESKLGFVKPGASYTRKVPCNDLFRLESSTIGIYEQRLITDIFNNSDEEFYQWKLNNVLDNSNFKHVNKFLEPYFFIKLETQHQGEFPLFLLYENDALCGFELCLYSRKRQHLPIEQTHSSIRIVQRNQG